MTGWEWLKTMFGHGDHHHVASAIQGLAAATSAVEAAQRHNLATGVEAMRRSEATATVLEARMDQMRARDASYVAAHLADFMTGRDTRCD